MQDSGMTQTLNFWMMLLEEVFVRWLLSHGLWLGSPDFDLWNSYLLRALKDRRHVNSSHSLQKFKYCIQRETAGISRLFLSW